MSRGLGKWEREIMNVVTYPGVETWVNIRDLLMLYVDNPNDPEWNKLSVDERIQDYCVHDGHAYAKLFFFIQDSLDSEGIVIYQSLMRAIRSLENKGFIKSRLEPEEDIESFKEDFSSYKPIKEITFNSKCLTNGIPWQLKYLNKRLTKIKRGEYV